MTDFIRRTARRMRMGLNRARMSVQFAKVDGKRKVVVHNAHRRAITILKHGVTAVGLLSAFVAFSAVWVAFAAGLILHFVGTAVERTAFSFRNMFIMPLPTFQIDKEKWLGMAFGYSQVPNSDIQLPTAGMLFSDTTYARNISELFSAWCMEEYDDVEENINASVVLRDEGEYSFLIYPNPARSTAAQFFDDSKKQADPKRDGEVQQEILTSFVLGKVFDILPGSYLPTFAKRYENGIPVIFNVLTLEAGQPVPVPDTPTYLLHGFRIKDQDSLTRRDFEYDLVK